LLLVKALGKKNSGEDRASLSFGKSTFRYGNLYALIPVLGLQVMPLPESHIRITVFIRLPRILSPKGYIDLPAVITGRIWLQTPLMNY